MSLLGALALSGLGGERHVCPPKGGFGSGGHGEGQHRCGKGFVYTLPGVRGDPGTAAGPGPCGEEALNLCAHTSRVHPFLRECVYILDEAQQETSSFSRLPWESRGWTSG